MNVQETLTVAQALNTDVGMYIIFISLVFLICFLFLCLQLLHIFKQLLYKVVEDISEKLKVIENDIKDLKRGGNGK